MNLLFNMFKLFSLQHDMIQNKLNELFTSLANERPLVTYTHNQIEAYTAGNQKQQAQKPIYENNFPELFFY